MVVYVFCDLLLLFNNILRDSCILYMLTEFFLLLCSIPSYDSSVSNIFIHSSVDGHLRINFFFFCFSGGSEGKESACNEGLITLGSTWVWPLGWDNPLEKGTTTHSSILAWRIPWTEEPGRLQSMGLQRVGHDWVTFSFIFLLFQTVLHSYIHVFSSTCAEILQGTHQNSSVAILVHNCYYPTTSPPLAIVLLPNVLCIYLLLMRMRIFSHD